MIEVRGQLLRAVVERLGGTVEHLWFSSGDYDVYTPLPVARPSSIVPDIDPSFERLILSCLDEEPQRHPTRVADVLAELPAAGRASSRQAAAPRSSGRQTPGRSGRPDPSIAVPFEDLSADGHDESFSAGFGSPSEIPRCTATIELSDRARRVPPG